MLPAVTDERNNPTALAHRSATAELRNSRSRLTWIADEDLATLRFRHPTLAALLSFFFGGGGQIYTGDTRMGILLMMASLFAFASAVAIDFPPFLWMFLGAISGILAFKKAQAINRYLDACQAHDRAISSDRVRSLALHQAPLPLDPHQPGITDAYRPVPGVTASRYTRIGARLQKISTLHTSGVIDEGEYQERKFEVLSELRGSSKTDIEDALYEFLPLIEHGIISRSDIDFVKKLYA